MAFRRFSLPRNTGSTLLRSVLPLFTAADVRPKPRDAFFRKWVDVSGVRVHYLEAGSGTPIVLVHGNMLDSEDFVASGIVEPLASRHRVIVFDRPGFGRTKRPRGTAWTPMRQATLLHGALQRLGIERPIVVGHSLGSLVSVALALAYPQNVRALTLLSGYYYPRLQAIAPILTFATLPLVGSLMRTAFAPVLGKLLRPSIAKQLFAPEPVATTYAAGSRARSQASHLRASIEDASYLDKTARLFEGRYRELAMPIEVLAGAGDAIVDSRAQSERFARDVPNARYATVHGAGHMIQYTALEHVLTAIADVERRSTLLVS